MFVYKLICRPTKRVYIGTSEYYPEINTLDVPKEVQTDFDNFGPDNFALFIVCELNDLDKATHKAEVLMEKESVKYEIAEQEQEVIDELKEEKPAEEEPEYEIVERFPDYPFEA